MHTRVHHLPALEGAPKRGGRLHKLALLRRVAPRERPVKHAAGVAHDSVFAVDVCSRLKARCLLDLQCCAERATSKGGQREQCVQ